MGVAAVTVTASVRPAIERVTRREAVWPERTSTWLTVWFWKPESSATMVYRAEGASLSFQGFDGGDVWIEGATADPSDGAARKAAYERACG